MSEKDERIKLTKEEKEKYIKEVLDTMIEAIDIYEKENAK